MIGKLIKVIFILATQNVVTVPAAWASPGGSLLEMQNLRHHLRMASTNSESAFDQDSQMTSMHIKIQQPLKCSTVVKSTC